MDNVPADASPPYRLVLVTIGGNDSLFGEIGIACVLPGSCNDLREHWLVNVGRIGPGITKAYEEIKEKVGEVPIVAGRIQCF